MQATVFCAQSLDGFIADSQGSVAWLDQCGQPQAAMGEQADMGFFQMMAAVDCIVMGRHTAQTLADFELTDANWPYGTTRLIVMSQQWHELPPSLTSRAELFAGSIAELTALLTAQGHQQLYVDGGALVQSFLRAGLVKRLIITQAPILLGDGRSLFGGLQQRLLLRCVRVERFANDFIQFEYEVAMNEENPHVG